MWFKILVHIKLVSTCALVKVLVERFESFLIADGRLSVVPPQGCPSFLQTTDLQAVLNFMKIYMNLCSNRRDVNLGSTSGQNQSSAYIGGLAHKLSLLPLHP